jgi:hypothetical protein
MYEGSFDNPFGEIISGSRAHSGELHIYVPSKFLADYQAAWEGWDIHPDLYRALEDYTVDGTLDGELDETKI